MKKRTSVKGLPAVSTAMMYRPGCALVTVMMSEPVRLLQYVW